LTFWQNKHVYAKVTRNCRWPETVEFTVLKSLLTYRQNAWIDVWCLTNLHYAITYNGICSNLSRNFAGHQTSFQVMSIRYKNVSPVLACCCCRLPHLWGGRSQTAGLPQQGGNRGHWAQGTDHSQVGGGRQLTMLDKCGALFENAYHFLSIFIECLIICWITCTMYTEKIKTWGLCKKTKPYVIKSKYIVW